MVIFDFDLTLVDTSPVEQLRADRNWKAVMAQAPNLLVYDGVHDLLSELHAAGQRLAIVTKSPDMVAKAFVRQHRWPIDIILGYHQVKQRKPHPEGLLLAMQKGGAAARGTFHVGDRPEDTEAAHAAGVVAIGAAWGAQDTAALRASTPHFVFDTVHQLRSYFSGR